MQGTIDPPRDETTGALCDQVRDLGARNDRLRTDNDRLRRENSELRRQNRQLRRTLDVHVARARSTALFGPLELTAGTCVGPRRQRG